MARAERHWTTSNFRAQAAVQGRLAVARTECPVMLGMTMTLWLAVALGAVISALWFAYLFITHRLPNQPFRKWEMFIAGPFFLLNAALIQLSLHFLGITEIHQRRSFFEIAMLVFLIPSLVMNLIISSRNR